MDYEILSRNERARFAFIHFHRKHIKKCNSKEQRTLKRKMDIKDKTAPKLPSIPSEISKETDANRKKYI